MASRKLIVEIIGDSRSLDRTFARSEKSAKGFFSTFSKGAVGMTAAFAGTAGVTAIMRDSITASSDLAEQQSKTTVVFGQSATEVKDWAKTTAQSFGIAERQALATASSFGALFAPLGLVGAQAADQSRLLTELGADLASFYNTDVQDALDAIRSGIVGESEPLRRYGVLLSETRVAQQALTDTGKKNVTQLTAQEKTLARISLIFADTAKAQGDFARTSAGLANQTRILRAEYDELKTTLGSKLLPVLTLLAQGMNELISDQGRLASAIRGGLVSALEAVPIVGAFTPLIRALRGKGEEAGKEFAEGFVTPISDVAMEGMRRRFQAARAARAEPRFRPTVEMRNQWFDARVARQIDRVQDLSLRRQLAQLREIANVIRARIAITKDLTRRLNLEDRLLGVLREQRSVQAQIADQIRAANEALKDRAEAIKSAVLDRLQRRQTDILNKRALADAKEQLRIARQIGGPEGIKQALRGLQDVRFDILRARLEAAPATLTKGGRFQLGAAVTVNVYGAESPEQVAQKVVQIIERRRRRTTTQQRGPAAGTRQGQK